MRHVASFLVFSLLLMTCASSVRADDDVQPEDGASKSLHGHLKAATIPVFREGHSLLPLSRWGWSMPFEVRVELAERWGYALEFGDYATHQQVDEVEKNPQSVNARLIALTAADPERYPLAVLTHRPLSGRSLETMPEDLLADYYLRDADGQVIPDEKTGKASWRTIDPLAPDAIFEWAAAETLAPLLRLREKAPLAVILNGGEYGLTVAGHALKYWEQSPAVLAAKGEKSWLDFMSEQKTRQELIISTAVREAFPERDVYLWYHFAGIPSWDGPAYSNGPELLAVSDFPDQSLYYRHFNTGWDGNRDLLTNFLHATAQAIPLGHPLSYNWVCGGWKEEAISPADRYLGFLKCLYTGGQIGAVAGYFSLPEGLKGDLVGEEPPPHLRQMMALGHAQALFSHVDEFLRAGDLLPGPHPHSREAKLPAYEFGEPCDTARVLVRRHRDRAAWLICAWAAAGDAREVTIQVPELGEATVLARPAGSLYLATSRHAIDYEPPVVSLKLLDTDPLDPTADWR